MRIVASQAATDFVAAGGGQLYVWLKRNRCCSGAFQTLRSATAAPPGIEFRTVGSADGFDVMVPALLPRLPDELYVELRRFPRRVETYWNGCVWVT